jgi:hypothetical protein
MATVTIPSPTPITGVRAPGGKPGVRLPVQQFQDKKPLAFSLYIQALYRWQTAGNEKWDPDNVDGTSYFQVTGKTAALTLKWMAD